MTGDNCISYKQPKVSMVMPCYNKQDYIGFMLESIYNQVWDNIELILVNDGSTDNTRAVISEWEPRLRERGFDVIVIDRENAGVITAAKTGLERITGDYVCQVDADDMLDPAYVSTMAGWLEKHPEHSFAICDHISYFWNCATIDYNLFKPPSMEDEFQNASAHILVNFLFGMVWMYMVRTDYFHKCGVIANYSISSRWTHEPGYILPLHAMGGRGKHITLPLYRFCVGINGMSQYKSFEYLYKYHTERTALFKSAIEALPESAADMHRKNELLRAADFAFIKYLHLNLDRFPDGPSYRERVINMLLDFVYSSFGKSYTREQIAGKERDLIHTISGIITKRELNFESRGRIIAYGAKGQRGARVIPHLRGTAMEPTVLWDIAAGDTAELFGIPLEKPNFDSLCETDTVLILPADKAVAAEVWEALRQIKLHNTIPYHYVYEYMLRNSVFPL